MGMKKGFFVLILLIMLMSSKTYDSNILMSGIGTSDLGAAIIGIMGALLIRSTEEKK